VSGKLKDIGPDSAKRVLSHRQIGIDLGKIPDEKFPDTLAALDTAVQAAFDRTQRARAEAEAEAKAEEEAKAQAAQAAVARKAAEEAERLAAGGGAAEGKVEEQDGARESKEDVQDGATESTEDVQEGAAQAEEVAARAAQEEAAAQAAAEEAARGFEKRVEEEECAEAATNDDAFDSNGDY